MSKEWCPKCEGYGDVVETYVGVCPQCNGSGYKENLPLPSEYLGGQEVLSVVSDHMQVIFNTPPHHYLNNIFSKNEEVTVLILKGAPK